MDHKKPSQLQATNQRLENIILGTDIGTWEWNVQTGETVFNERWADIIGYSLDELQPTTIETWMKYAHPDDLEESGRLLEEHFNGESEFYVFEARMKHREGHWVWVLDKGKVVTWTEDGKPEWVMGSHQDITDRKNLEAELLHFKDLLERSNKVARIGHWEVDLEAQKPTWSPVTKEIHEVEPGEEPDLASAIEFYKPGESRDKINFLFNRALDEGVPFDDEFEIITAKGNRRWVRSVGLPQFSGGKCSRIYGLFQDITAKKLIEEENEELLEKMNNQNRRLLNFAHIVSHNLRSHTGNFQMMLGLLEKEEDQEEWRKMLRLIKMSADGLKTTIDHLNEVVEFTTLDSEDLRPISVKDSLDNSINNLIALIDEAGAELDTDVPAALKVIGIPAYLESILLNLITNAIKYKHPDRAPKLEVSAQEQEEKVKIWVKDNGSGIDLNRHGERIFGMYKTFHGNKDARGVGLFISKNQVESMGGTIEVDSVVGEGSTFTVTLKRG